MSAFAKRISNEEERIYEIRVPCPDGREAYYRLSVDKRKEGEFKKACKAGLTVNIKKFGKVLESYFISGKLN